jgi:lycopene cyclase CruP
MPPTAQILAQLPGDGLGNLRRTDALWQALRSEPLPVPTVIQSSATELAAIAWDVVICGGTLGIMLGAALALKGWRVALLERGVLRGRQQEWNISRQELQVLVALELLTEAELAQAIATVYNPARISFLGGSDIWVKDVLNIGVDPVFLLETLKQRFLAAGGQLFEQTPFVQATVHANGVSLNGGKFYTRLLLDVMGHGSPIVQQARNGQKPDAVCLVVGTCAQGYPANESGDLLASFTPIQNHCQYFWEAFPARDGRTTYLFTYLDADRRRFSLESLFDEYFRLLPEYQAIDLAQLQFQRALFGFFPCYRDSPLRSTWNRILPAGDSSGSQSPLSFGGFGAMMRHLDRLVTGIDAALQVDLLDRADLSLLQPYQPNLSVTWLFQKTMSVGLDQTVAPNQINQLLSSVFQTMQSLGEPTLKPFLQDVIQFLPLFKTLTKTSFTHPGMIAQIIPQVGIPTLLNWFSHYVNLAGYTALDATGRSLQPWLDRLSPLQQYYWQRRRDAWQYGSGGDYDGAAINRYRREPR